MHSTTTHHKRAILSQSSTLILLNFLPVVLLALVGTGLSVVCLSLLCNLLPQALYYSCSHLASPYWTFHWGPESQLYRTVSHLPWDSFWWTSSFTPKVTWLSCLHYFTSFSRWQRHQQSLLWDWGQLHPQEVRLCSYPPHEEAQDAAYFALLLTALPKSVHQSWRLTTTNTPCMRHVTISHLLPIIQASCDNFPSYSKVFILKVIYGTRDCSVGEVLAGQT